MAEDKSSEAETSDTSRETFFVRSAPHLYVIRSSEGPYCETVGGLTVRELYEAVHDDTLPDGVGYYSIIVEGSVASEREMLAKSDKAYRLAEDLNRVWTYVCGHPLNVSRLVLVKRTAPSGWTSDVPEISERISAELSGMIAKVEIKTRYCVHLPYFPLSRALLIRKTFLSASYVTRVLITLHYMALTSSHSDARLFFLAKALEVVRAILPGGRDDEKQKRLRKDVATELNRGSLHWLYEMANERLNVRHAVKKGKTGPELHRRMSPEEHRDFEHDADLVIRSVVCCELGEEPVILKDGVPKAGT